MLIDFLLIDGTDPYVIDADVPEGPLRAVFPGRTALVDLNDIRGQMKLFDTILASPGRDYVIDLPAAGTPVFSAAAVELNFTSEARKLGFAIAVLFVIDKDPKSVDAAAGVQSVLQPDLFIPVRNAHVGSAYRPTLRDLVIDMPALDRELANIIEARRFSFRAFMLGDEGGVPKTHGLRLKEFLAAMTTGFQEISPSLSLAKLRAGR